MDPFSHPDYHSTASCSNIEFEGEIRGQKRRIRKEIPNTTQTLIVAHTRPGVYSELLRPIAMDRRRRANAH
jgi:hypothetical protein